MSFRLEWPAPACVRPPAFGPWIEARFSPGVVSLFRDFSQKALALCALCIQCLGLVQVFGFSLHIVCVRCVWHVCGVHVVREFDQLVLE
jgi:hypothetical protein